MKRRKRGKALWRIICVLLVLLLSSPIFAVRGEKAKPMALRALLLGCDRFVTAPEFSPASQMNLQALEQVLSEDERGYLSVRQCLNRALDEAAFSELVQSCFEGAEPQDLSLFYLSTHGFVGDDGSYYALMSDGEKEYALSDQAMKAALDKVPGTKLLILDTCFSGAAIAKGSNSLQVSHGFTGPQYKVISSSGGAEPSFLWRDAGGVAQGGSYFAGALFSGLSQSGGFAADEDRDGAISLSELMDYLRLSYGASVPYSYPERDDYPLFQCNKNKIQGDLLPLTGLNVESECLSAGDKEIVFSFTLNRPERLSYQLIYEKDGAWRFTAPQSITDTESPDGVLKPGRKERRLLLQSSNQEQYGYLLLLITAVYEDTAEPLSCTLLSVEREIKDAFKLESSQAFAPALGEEAALIIRHEGPARFEITLINEADQVVRRLSQRRAPRPMHLSPEGSCFYWDGLDDQGQPLPKGIYRFKVGVWDKGIVYEKTGNALALQ